MDICFDGDTVQLTKDGIRIIKSESIWVNAEDIADRVMILLLLFVFELSQYGWWWWLVLFIVLFSSNQK